MASDPAAFARMCELLAHRGPDDRGTFVSGPIGLAHTRLALLDLTDAGHQPWVEGDHALVFNGEIYNFREERALLEATGATFESGSESRVSTSEPTHGSVALDGMVTGAG